MMNKANENKPISGIQVRMEWLKDELRVHMKACAETAEIHGLVGWFMKYGFNLGIRREQLLELLEHEPTLQAIAKTLTPEEIAVCKPPPAFRTGDRVEVVVNSKNLNYHNGTVRDVLWHFKEERWQYFIEEGGRRVSKRYYEEDLKRIGERSWKVIP